MMTRRMVKAACAAAVIGLVMAASGSAASAVLTTTAHLTFSGSVSLPGVTLTRGTYTFELVEGNPDIVRVLNRDHSRVYYTGFTRRVDRPARIASNQMATLAETPRGFPPQVDTWYPVGGSSGHQFIHSAR